MAPVAITPVVKRLTIGAAIVVAVLLVIYLQPSSRPRELLLLGLLAFVALAPVSLIMYQHSLNMLRATRLTRRERALFKTAADGSLKPFAICKPVYNRQGHTVDYKFTYTNRSLRHLLECQANELPRQSVSHFLSSLTPEPLFTILDRVVKTARKTSLEMRVLHGKVEFAVVEAQLVPLGSSVALSVEYHVLEDVTSARIRELQDFAQSIIESAPICMIVTDAEGTIVAMNAAGERLTQYGKHEVVGRFSMTRLHDPAELHARSLQLNRDLKVPIAPGFGVLVAKSQPNESEQQEWTYIRKDGSRVWVNLTMTTLQTPEQKVTGHLGIAFDITERKQLTDSVVYMARHDQLTGLPNRTVLNDRMSQEMQRVRRYGKRLAVLMVDLDHFKRINDSLGHVAGDSVLTYVSSQLSLSLRSTDTIARVGGDEFVVLMPDFGDRNDAERCAAMLLQKISTPITIDQREVRMTASIGISLFPDDAATANDLLRKADLAMYEAKAEGRGCARSFSSEMEKEAADRLEMEQDLRHAFIAGEFELHYQPQIRCATGQVDGMEMLIRWKSPKRGNVPPNLFIPVAEQAGLMVQIGEWGLRQACLDCMEAQRQSGRKLHVAVNLSPRQLSQKNLVPLIKDVLAESGLDASNFELEITEQMLMTNTPGVRETLQQLRALGVSIAIDDFGTGFSSFTYILEYQVDRLKVDRSFVSGVNDDQTAAAIVRAIIAMGRGLNIELVAEGVETQEQMNFLLRKRCDSVQGFLFSKAVPIDQFVACLREIESRGQRALTQNVLVPSSANQLLWSEPGGKASLPA